MSLIARLISIETRRRKVGACVGRQSSEVKVSIDGHLIRLIVISRMKRPASSDMVRKLIAAAAWALLAFIIYATLTSMERRPELTDVEFSSIFTVLERIGAYEVLGLLFSFAYPRRESYSSPSRVRQRRHPRNLADIRSRPRCSRS